MGKTFRAWDVDQVWLLPPSIQDLVPAGHRAHFVRDTVRHALDRSAIMAVYDDGTGGGPKLTLSMAVVPASSLERRNISPPVAMRKS